jgi:hypothetical protein
MASLNALLDGSPAARAERALVGANGPLLGEITKLQAEPAGPRDTLLVPASARMT